ncbi:MAG TPA: crosslink repair DNA glycosylase YcaQ family protein [Tepidiformaceae bacterium]|nr:crosslink repair DNA glycosylase YcaQ family protein [Tepidiformaceae bacterium]
MLATLTLSQLRHYAVRRSIGRPAGLREAIGALGFVQADPIRAPARAQDLILRHRVRAYRAGQLEREYPGLDVEEDYFVNYGFLSRDLHALLHPRNPVRGARIEQMAPGVSARVLEFIATNGPTDSRTLVAAMGKQQVVSGWGQGAEAATRALNSLHFRGVLRVVSRANGNKVFGLASTGQEPEDALPVEERARRLLLAIVRLYAPVASSTLVMLTRFLGYGAPEVADAAKKLLREPAFDEIVTMNVEGVRYAWPAGDEFGGDAPEKVRFLAPFDPVCWDRVRFEHLHGWAYRFEAYTPPGRRIRGYYSLPLLWRERIIGWANVSVRTGTLEVELGFEGDRPATKSFARELDAEIERMGAFLGVVPAARTG